MSRLCNATTDRITQGTAALPLIGSLAFWFYPTWVSTDGVDHILMDVTQNAVSPISFFRWEKSTANHVLFGWYGADVDYRVGVLSGNFTLNQNAWNLWVLTWDDTANQSLLYLNNTGPLTSVINNGLVAFTSSVTRTLGNYSAGQGDVNLAARLAEWALWSRVLTSTERTDLFGFIPANVAAPSGLVDYLPLIGDTSPEPNLAGGTVGTVTGTTQAAHPPMVTTPVYDQVAYRWRAKDGSLFAPP